MTTKSKPKVQKIEWQEMEAVSKARPALAKALNEIEARLDRLDERINTTDRMVSRLTVLEDSVRLLIEARNDQALRIAELYDMYKQLRNVTDTQRERLGDVESNWRQHAKVSMERYQDVRLLQAAIERLATITHEQQQPVATVATDAEQWVLSFGNPSDGFEYVGPFTTATDAIDYGEQWMPGQEWWTILLQVPAKE